MNWISSSLKYPIYVHAIAGASIALGSFIASNIEPNAPANKWWLLGKWWIALIMPALVYVGFAVYGRLLTGSVKQIQPTATRNSKNTSESDPLKRLSNAYRAVYAVGGLSIFLGLLAVTFMAKAPGGIIGAILFLVFGIFYLFLGYCVQRQSPVALGIAVSLMALNALVGIYAIFQTGSVMGIIIPFLFLSQTWRGFEAIRELKRSS